MATLREFRRAVCSLVASNDLPDYRLTYDDKKDVLKVRNCKQALAADVSEIPNRPSGRLLRLRQPENFVCGFQAAFGYFLGLGSCIWIWCYSSFCVEKRHLLCWKHPPMNSIGSHFALHLPFYATKSALKVECQQLLGLLTFSLAAVFLVKIRACRVKNARKMSSLAALFSLHPRIFPQKTASQSECQQP